MTPAPSTSFPTAYIVLLLLCLAVPVMGQRLVMPGDFPDPSVVQIGDTYWASTSSANWAPAFPLLASKDLETWEFRGHVFPQLPEWADSYFRAPEITYDSTGVYVYYTARKRGGNLCVGIARADGPEGPYQDLGPIMCQDAGSIDAFPVRDNDGTLYLVWKEHGNSIGKPTPIWAAKLTPERTGVIGEPFKLFQNDAPWEKSLVEGVSITRHGKYLYAFYTAANCQGRDCVYATGIARSRNLHGPWQKYRGNPVLEAGARWKGPGHGTPVERNGHYYFLHDAHDDANTAFTGRQGVLSEFTYTNDGWLRFEAQDGHDAPIPARLIDAFDGGHLAPQWSYSTFQKPQYNVGEGALTLNSMPSPCGAYVAQKLYATDVEAEVTMKPAACTAESGIALVSDDLNMLRATLVGSKVSLWKIAKGHHPILLAERFIRKTDSVMVRIVVRDGREAIVTYSTNGTQFNKLNTDPASLTFLQSRDRAIRVALVAIGDTDRRACFEHFTTRVRKPEVQQHLARSGPFRRRER
ncbi:glycoside hydrolase family 43 protein [Parachryseolinea silvisoli]|uniref:glycoside hydrolase family 43 protein n=1 Tax=Parachryseolinea silvisoli TaxID=2873601 RepID=UPI00226581D1|nr:glycoside hydrolase family 43 protein [Parachryseolinea silvisoli]MCD9018716.1 family 43 glycosylhydrolase [Parachryseolinea silvisoli]